MQSNVNHPKHFVISKKFTPVSIRLIVRAGNYSNAWKSKQKYKKNSHLFELLKIHSNAFSNNQELQSNCPGMSGSHNMLLWEELNYTNNSLLGFKENVSKKIKDKSHLWPEVSPKLLSQSYSDFWFKAPELSTLLTNKKREEGLHLFNRIYFKRC